MKAPVRSGSDAVCTPGGHKRGDHGDHGLIPPLAVVAPQPSWWGAVVTSIQPQPSSANPFRSPCFRQCRTASPVLSAAGSNHRHSRSGTLGSAGRFCVQLEDTRLNRTELTPVATPTWDARGRRVLVHSRADFNDETNSPGDRPDRLLCTITEYWALIRLSCAEISKWCLVRIVEGVVRCPLWTSTLTSPFAVRSWELASVPTQKPGKPPWGRRSSTFPVVVYCGGTTDSWKSTSRRTSQGDKGRCRASATA